MGMTLTFSLNSRIENCLTEITSPNFPKCKKFIIIVFCTGKAGSIAY